jgi:hypothetical protein
LNIAVKDVAIALPEIQQEIAFVLYVGHYFNVFVNHLFPHNLKGIAVVRKPASVAGIPGIFSMIK